MSDDVDVFHKFKKDDIDQFMENDLYLPTRTLYMGSITHFDEGEESGTDYAMAERMVKALHILETHDAASKRGEKPITIIMNNIGGDIFHGMAIYDAIRNCTNHVTIKVYGHAMSMGSIILQAADQRIMSPNSKIMVHYGQLSMSGHSNTSKQWTIEDQKFCRFMEQLFLEKVGDRTITLEEYYHLIGKIHRIPSGNAKNKKIKIDLDAMENILNFDAFIDADMALKLNFIDKVEE